MNNFIKKQLDSMKNFFKKKKNESLHERSGTLDFTAGEYEIFVHTELFEHENIDFNIETIDHSTCSHLSGDKFSIEEKEKGFLLRATVESNEVKFHWKVK